MLIPIRCVTCGHVLADKWLYFSEKRDQLRADDPNHDNTHQDGTTDTKVGKLLDELGLKRMCCRRHMLGHVDIVDQL